MVALGGAAGGPLAASWHAGRQHGETLLPAIETLLRDAGVARTDLAAIVVGTGPGAFTGLRVGLATAKTMAHELGCPIVGIPDRRRAGRGRRAAGGGLADRHRPAGRPA